MTDSLSLEKISQGWIAVLVIEDIVIGLNRDGVTDG